MLIDSKVCGGDNEGWLWVCGACGCRQMVGTVARRSLLPMSGALGAGKGEKREARALSCFLVEACKLLGRDDGGEISELWRVDLLFGWLWLVEGLVAAALSAVGRNGFASLVNSGAHGASLFVRISTTAATIFELSFKILELGSSVSRWNRRPKPDKTRTSSLLRQNEKLRPRSSSSWMICTTDLQELERASMAEDDLDPRDAQTAGR